MEHLNTFLARQPPFDELTPEELRALVQSAEEQTFEPGEPVLVEDGPPAPGVWVILTGSMDLLHEGEVIQILEPGETFGHPSLLTGMAPAFTVRARERSSCAFVGAAPARRSLGTQAGAAYVAQTMRQRLTGAGETVHGLLDVGTTPVAAIMRPPAFCEPGRTVREAAAQLSADGVSALLVQLSAQEVGIVTDAEVRDAVADTATSLDGPVREIVRHPLVSVPASQLAVEATIDMLASGGEHLAVLDGGRVCGVLSASDLLGLDARSPIALRHLILGAADEDELVHAVGQLPKVFMLLLRAGVPARDLGRVLSLQHDAVVARLIDFSIWRHGEAPVAWAWLDLGSAARREFTLASDQDNALAYADPEPGEEAHVDAYFERLGSDVNDGLARCGIGIDNNGVMARKRLWRMSKGDWLRTFDECLRIPDESHLIRASVAFDFRPAAGGLTIAPQLTEHMRAARARPDFMRLMARTASGFPVAVGFRGQLVTGRNGDPPERVDLKRGAIIPLVNLVRFHALAHSVTVSATLERLEAVASTGGIDRRLAEALAEAFDVITRVRFEHHADRISAGAAPDNLINPDQLAPIAHADLREALHVVKRAQKQLGVWTPAGK
ncbi:MAG: CBS domain-containing protein [Solirubrobacterales bacterium]|nr:CBS domain-containing protein [Solirubrobacterales bacterium]